MIRQWLGLVLALFPAAGWSTSTLEATARLSAPDPPFGETPVTVNATHTGVITSFDTADASYTWIIQGTLQEKATFFYWPEIGNCSKSAGAQAVKTLTCEVVWAGECGTTYKTTAETQLNYPVLLGPGPGDSDTKEATPRCNMTSGPLNPLTNGCEPDSCTPIVINLDGAGFRFTSLEDGVRFDIDADGEAEHLAWTAPNGRDAFLVLDRNGNGRIDNGAELFGGATSQPASEEPNGFAALAVFDDAASGGNGDGVISAADSVYERLGLWIDANHDAVSQAHEVTPLFSEKIQAIDLTPVVSQRRDRHGNRSKWASHVLFLHSLRLAALDVIFLAE